MKLTAKQRAFAHHVADGMPASEAYRRAYSPHSSPINAATEAYRLRNRPAIAAFIAELQAEVRQIKLAERVDKRRVLAQQIYDRDLSATERQNAIKIDNLMTGDNSPVRVEGEITLGSILREIVSTTGLPRHDRRPGT